MNHSRGIIKSIKNIPTESDQKKVQLIIHNSHKLIESDEELEEPWVQKDLGSKRKFKIKNSGSRSQKNLGSSSRSFTARQRTVKTRGCLKKEGSLKNIPGGEEDEMKSSKSIKFNIRRNDVFEYTVGEKSSKRNGSKKIVKQLKAEEACCQIY